MNRLSHLLLGDCEFDQLIKNRMNCLVAVTMHSFSDMDYQLCNLVGC